MATYVYVCRQCRMMFEVQMAFAEKSAGLQPPCPHGCGTDTHQLITDVKVVRAGSGKSGGGCCGPNSGSGSGCCG